MKATNLNKEILRLAAPAIINNITVPLLGLCDTAIAGHLGSASYLGAIAIGSMMLNVFFWLAGFLRMGTTGLTAISFGRGSRRECREILGKSLILAAGISGMVLGFQQPILDLLIKVISPEPDTSELARLYFKIGVWGVPAQLAVMAVSGWFIGLQTTVVPMTIAIITNVINILCSLLFAFGLSKGFVGIIYGTFCANWAGCAIALTWAALRLRKERRAEPKDSKIQNGTVKWSDLFSVNGALFVRSACIMAVTLTVTSVGARLGDLTLAANAVIMQFFIFFSYFMDGFAFSGEALAGRYSGAQNPLMVKETMKKLCQWGLVMAVIFFAIYYFWSDNIASLLTDRPEILTKIEEYRLWIMLLPPLTVAAFIFDGLFVGLTRTQEMMWVTIAGAGTFFILLFLSGLPVTNNLLWIGFESYLFIRGGALALIFLKKFTSTGWK